MDVVMPRMDGLEACRRADERVGIPGLLSAGPVGLATAVWSGGRPVAELQRRVDTALEDRALEPGDVCFIDSFQAVHGRKPFKARYDGNGRWLKRIDVVRDPRKPRVPLPYWRSLFPVNVGG